MPNNHPTGTLARSIVFWCVLLPQCLLIASNIYGWILVVGDAQTEEVNNALMLFAYQIGLFAFFATVWVLMCLDRVRPSMLLVLTSLIVQIGYLYTFLYLIEDIIPVKTQAWIVAEENVGRWNFTLLMPGLFITLYALTKGVFQDVSVGKKTGISLSIIIAVPIIWYLLISLKQPLWSGQFITVVWVIIGTTMVLAFLSALLNLVDNLTQSALYRKAESGHYIFAILIGLAAPLGGLYLNRSIPFPSNLQIFEIYALTIANAAILLIKPGQKTGLSIIVFLRFALLPFVGYIFFLFLPFLPLSLFAILLVGAGFLMLSPLVLGLFQWQISYTDLQHLQGKIGSAPAMAVATLGVFMLPAYLGLQAWQDKRAMHQTLNHFYAHNPDSSPLSSAQVERSRTALQQLQARKDNAQLPYISAMYNQIVFGQMVLSDEKIDQTYRWLTNAPVPSNDERLFGSGRARRNWRPRVVKPHTDVTLEASRTDATQVGKTTVHLTLKNNQADTHALYYELLHLPEGAFVTGLRLKINGSWVSGRIFDKKSALWVFEKITEVRRDPAIIVYEAPDKIALRVYPFPSDGVREVELDFSYHPRSESEILFGEQPVSLNGATRNDHFAYTSNGATLVNTGDQLLHYRRKPYLHFILDYSKGSVRHTQSYLSDIKSISEELGIKHVAISAANIVSSPSAPTLFPIENEFAIAKAIDQLKLPEQGGFWCEQALAREVKRLPQLSYDTSSDHVMPAHLKNAPVFIMLHKLPYSGAESCHYLPAFWQLPDIQYYYRFGGDSLKRYSLLPHNSGAAQEDPAQPDAVLAVRQEDQVHLLRANEPSIIALDHQRSVDLYHPEQQKFLLIPPEKLGNTEATQVWQSATGAWLEWRQALGNPHALEQKRKTLLSYSRDLSVLLPSSAFIVVEHASQWEILKRKEKQALDNHSALDFEEAQDTPEPPELVLIVLLLLGISYMHFRSRKRRFIA